MKRKLLSLVALVSLFSFTAGAASLERGDELFGKRNLTDQTPIYEAIKEFKALAAETDDEYEKYEALWKISWCYYWLGQHAKGKDAKKKLHDAGMEYGKQAKSMKPEEVEGHYFYGINLGKWGKANGVIASLFKLKELRATMNRAKELDPSFEGAGAYRTLGKVQCEVPSYATGSLSESEELLRKAIKITKQNGEEWSYPLNHVYLATTLGKRGKKDEARKLFNEVINHSYDKEDFHYPEILDAIAEAKVELKKL